MSLTNDIRERAEETLILEDHKYGRDRHERKARLELAKKVSMIFVYSSSIFFVAWLIHNGIEVPPAIYQAVMWLAVVFPLIAIGVIYEFKGLIKISGAISAALFFSASMLVVVALGDYDIEFNARCWWISGTAAAILSVVGYVAGRELSAKDLPKAGDALMVAAILFGHAFGTFAFINCYYDNTIPAKQAMVIVDKETDSKRNHYVRISALNESSRTSFDVSGKRYESVKAGDSVTVVLHQGLLGSPWLELDFGDRKTDGIE